MLNSFQNKCLIETMPNSRIELALSDFSSHSSLPVKVTLIGFFISDYAFGSSWFYKLSMCSPTVFVGESSLCILAE